MREVCKEVRQHLAKVGVGLHNCTLSHVFLGLEKLIPEPPEPTIPQGDYAVRSCDLKTLIHALDNMKTESGLKFLPAQFLYERSWRVGQDPDHHQVVRS